MPTATKNARSKTKKVVTSTDAEETAPEGDAIPSKIKKPIEIDEPEPVIGIEEKPEEDPLLGAVEEDEASEEAVLDGEELNPFGDRWEE